MIVRNFLKTESRLEPSHEGEGVVKNVFLFGDQDFDTKLKFIIYTEMEPGTSIGYHEHGQNEEIYVVLEGKGTMETNGESQEVEKGDAIVNKPGWSHGLKNTSQETLKILVFEVDK